MRFNTFLARCAAPALALALLVGCADARHALSGEGDLPTLSEAGLYPSISVRASGGHSIATLSLAQGPGGVQLASYQGEITYDVRALTLDKAALPEGITGAIHETSPGRLRFVGTSLEGVGEVPLLSLRFRQGGALSREMFSVRFEEVTAAGDLSDVTGTVKHGVLLFQSGR